MFSFQYAAIKPTRKQPRSWRLRAEVLKPAVMINTARSNKVFGPAVMHCITSCWSQHTLEIASFLFFFYFCNTSKNKHHKSVFIAWKRQ